MFKSIYPPVDNGSEKKGMCVCVCVLEATNAWLPSAWEGARKGANLGYSYSPYIPYEQWGAGWSYLEFPNHLIAEIQSSASNSIYALVICYIAMAIDIVGFPMKNRDFP